MVRVPMGGVGSGLCARLLATGACVRDVPSIARLAYSNVDLFSIGPRDRLLWKMVGMVRPFVSVAGGEPCTCFAASAARVTVIQWKHRCKPLKKFADFNGGKAKKARIGRRAASDDREGVALLPKVSVRTVVSSDMVDTIVDNVVERLGGGTFGNGKIFVRPVTSAVRMRTNERGEVAL